MNARTTRVLHRATQSACACVVAAVALFVHTGQAHALITDDVFVSRNDTTASLEIFVNDPVGSDVTITSTWNTIHINDPHGALAGIGCTTDDANNVHCDSSTITSVTFFGHVGADMLTTAPTFPFPITAYGSSGNDMLMGGTNTDRLFGDEGNDRLLGRSSSDDLRGGSGGDRLVGGSGDDRIRGGSGNDVMHAGSGNDGLLGGAGNDTMYSNGDTGFFDYLSGGLGTDQGRFDLGADTTSGVDIWL